MLLYPLAEYVFAAWIIWRGGWLDKAQDFALFTFFISSVSCLDKIQMRVKTLFLTKNDQFSFNNNS